MAYKIGDVEFLGIIGAVQKAKPVVETYTRAGDNKIWVQKVNTSSPQSTLSCFKDYKTLTEVNSTIIALKNLVGKRVAIETAGFIVSSCYVIDFTYRINKVSSINPFVLNVDVIVIADEKTEKKK